MLSGSAAAPLSCPDMRRPCPSLQAPPAWCLLFATLRPAQFDAFGPRFLTQGTVQLLMGESSSAAVGGPACVDACLWRPACLLLAWLAACPPALRACLPVCLACPPACLPVCLPAWLANLPACLPASPSCLPPAAAAALDSWERLREAAAAVLLRLPSPLPGFATPAALAPLLRRALRLLACPRGREADAGAQLLLLLLRKYGGGDAGGCCWGLDVVSGAVEAPPTPPPPPPAGAAESGAEEEAREAALWCFLESACRLLQRRVELAQADMLGACRGGLAQGALLALR